MINCQATKRPTHCDILSKTKVTFSTDGFLVAEVIRNIRVPEAVKKKKKKRFYLRRTDSFTLQIISITA